MITVLESADETCQMPVTWAAQGSLSSVPGAESASLFVVCGIVSGGCCAGEAITAGAG